MAKIYGVEVILDDNGRVKYGVDYTRPDSPKTVYPYKWDRKHGGWDNCSGEYSVEVFRSKVKNETGIFC